MTVCLTEVRQAAKELLNEDDAKALIENIQERARAKAEAKAISYEQALRESADNMAAQMDRDVKLAKFQQYKNIVKRADRDNFYKSFGNDVKALKAITVGVATGKGGKQSTALLQRKVTGQLLGGFYRDLKETGVLEVFESKEYEQILAQELTKPGSTGNNEARQVAEIYKKWADISRRMQNAEGADIGSLDEYMGRQSHNADLMRRTQDSWLDNLKDRINYNKERLASGEPYDGKYFYEKAYRRWKDFILPRLDHVRTFIDGAEPEKFLRSVYDNLISGVHNKEIEASERMQAKYAFQGPGNLAKRLSQERKLHFKDGIAFYEYNKKFGNTTMHSNLLQTFDNAGKNIGLLRIWGTNPEAAFKRDLRSMQESPENKRNPKIEKAINNNQKLQQYFDILTGVANNPANSALARRASNIRAWKSMAALPLTTFRSIPDIAKHAAQMHASTGQTFMTAMRDSMLSMMQGMPKGELEHIADLTNVWARGVHDSVISKFSAADAPGGFTAKSMQVFFKYNWMNWWSEALTKGTGISVARNLAIQRGMAFENLHPNAQYTFDLYGINAKAWDLIRTAKVKGANNEEFITADAMDNLSHEEIAKYLDKDMENIKPYEFEQVKRDMNDRVGMYITDQASQVNPENMANVRRLMYQGTRPGTPIGELLRFIGQFKAYTADFTMNILGRDVGRMVSRMREGENFADMMRRGAGDIWGLSQFIGWTTALWYIGNGVADIAKGKQPRPLDSPKTWISALAGGGGLGIYGDFLFGEYTANRFGGGFLETAAGPVLSDVAGILKLLGKLKSGDDPTNAAFQLFKNNIPFLNLFYSRIALDYAILYGIQERISPGSLHRMENRLRKEQEQEFIFAPSQYALGQ